MLFEALVLSFIIGFLRGGSIRRLEKLNLRMPFLFILAFLVQFLLPLFANYLFIPRMVGFYILLCSYAILLLAIGLNWKSFYFKLMGLGIFSNFLVIFLNKGMPVSLSLLKKMALPENIARIKNMEDFLHVPLTNKTYLWFLADIIPLPKPYPFPSIFSVGDLILSIGIFFLIQDVMVYKGRRRKKAASKFLKVLERKM